MSSSHTRVTSAAFVSGVWPHTASGPAEFRFRKGRVARSVGAQRRAELANFAAVGGAPAVQRAIRQETNRGSARSSFRPAPADAHGTGNHGYRRPSLRVSPRVSAGACSAAPAATRSEAAAATLSMPPGPPMTPAPGGGVGVFRFDQAQADQSPVLIHSLDRVAVQLQLADHGRWGVKPSRAQRGERHRLLTGLTQLLKRQTMLSLNEHHRTELSTPGPRRSRLRGQGIVGTENRPKRSPGRRGRRSSGAGIRRGGSGRRG